MTEKQRILKGNPRRTRAFISLGSNDGDRVGFVQQSVQFLKDVEGISVKDSSSLYETEPLGVGNPQWFVNAVAAIDTTLSAEQLLEACKEIEARLMRMHGVEESEDEDGSPLNRRRIIDLDILFFGDELHDSDTLRIPHPNITHRAYALVPLLEIAPDYVHPRLNKTIGQIHESLPQPEQVFLYGTRDADRHRD